MDASFRGLENLHGCIAVDVVVSQCDIEVGEFDLREHVHNEREGAGFLNRLPELGDTIGFGRPSQSVVYGKRKNGGGANGNVGAALTI